MGKAISEHKKQRIRKRYHDDGWSITHIVTAFKVSEESVRRYIDDQYAYLDFNDCPADQYRVRGLKYYSISAILSQWYNNQAGCFRARDIILIAEKAWERIADPRLPQPFFKSLVQRWQKHNKVTVYHEQKKEILSEELDTIMRCIGSWNELDMYGIADTRLLLRHPQSLPHEGSQISIILGTNAAGTDRLTPVVVGSDKITAKNMKDTGVRWEGCPFGGVSSTLIYTLLQSFYEQFVCHRQVLLLLPSTYRRVVEICRPPRNIKVLSFPCGKDHLHPLHQGPIKSFKINYRTSELQSIVNCRSRRVDHSPTPTRKSMKRLARVWKHELGSHSIRYGFARAPTTDNSAASPSIPNFEILFRRAQRSGAVHEQVSPQSFLHPDEENVPASEYVLEQVINAAIGQSERE